MNKPKKMQTLFFLLIPVGIVILILSIRMVRNTFSGNIILEIPYAQKNAQFTINKSGNYSIWHMGQFFRRAPLDEFRPVITNESDGTEIKLYSSIFRPNANNGINARMELFRFSAPAGAYKLELVEGSSISKIENTLIKQLPVKMVETDKYFIQIRKSQPFIFVIAGIVLIIFSGLCIIGGLVFGILSDQIFSN